MRYIRLFIHVGILESVKTDSFRLPINIKDEVLVLPGNDSEGAPVGRLQRNPDSVVTYKNMGTRQKLFGQMRGTLLSSGGDVMQLTHCPSPSVHIIARVQIGVNVRRSNKLPRKVKC